MYSEYANEARRESAGECVRLHKPQEIVSHLNCQIANLIDGIRIDSMCKMQRQDLNSRGCITLHGSDASRTPLYDLRATLGQSPWHLR